HPCRRLALPLAGRAGDFHPQVILKHHPQEQRRSRRCAPCLAHHTKKRHDNVTALFLQGRE
ncbi:hypothetical protein, partial [Vreelandella titanicae]|uniref:hypothetical protein n=1 Tax=Vreelandella titanicae TaxID=664683 RepID=UPI004044BBFD